MRSEQVDDAPPKVTGASTHSIYDVVEELPEIADTDPGCYTCRNRYFRLSTEKDDVNKQKAWAVSGKVCTCGDFKPHPDDIEHRAVEVTTHGLKEFSSWKTPLISFVITTFAFAGWGPAFAFGYLAWWTFPVAFLPGWTYTWYKVKLIKHATTYISNRVENFVSDRMQSHAYKKYQDIRQKITDPLGLGTSTETIQNLFVGIASTISVSVIAGIVYATYAFITKKKKKIMEGATPSELAPAYVKAILVTLAAMGATAGALVYTSTLVNAIKNLTRLGDGFFSKPSRRVAKKGSVTQVRGNITKEVIAQVAKGKVFADPSVKFAVYAAPINYHGGLPSHGSKDLKDLVDILNDKLKDTYPGLGFQKHAGCEIPDFQTKIGQVLQADILATPAVNVGAPTFWLWLAREWLAQMRTIHPNTKPKAKVSIMVGGTPTDVDLGSKSPAIAHIVGYLYSVAPVADTKDLALWQVQKDEESFTVIATSEEHARTTLMEAEGEVTFLDFVVGVRDYISEHKLMLTGLIGVIVCIYFGTYYYFKSTWQAKTLKKKEGRGKNTTKGQNIGRAQQLLSDEQYQAMIRKRDQLRNDLRDLYASKRADEYDGDYDYDYQKDITAINAELRDLVVNIEDIYNGDLSGGVTHHSNASHKKTWGDRALPNSMKSRKNKESDERKEGAVPCSYLGCVKTGKTLCNDHFDRLCEKNTPPLLYNALALQDIKDIVRIKKENKNYKQCSGVCVYDIAKGECPKHKKKADSKDGVTSVSNSTKEPSPSVEPIVPKVKEARVSDHNNADSTRRQYYDRTPRAIRPIYISKGDGYVRNGVMVRMRNGKGEQPKWYTAYHVTRAGEAFYKENSVYKAIKFADLGNDLAVTDAQINCEGKVFTMASEPIRAEHLTMYTFHPNTDEPYAVHCSGYWNAHEFCHDSDTFPAQCGSPYVTNGIVLALHNNTDSYSNNAYSVLAQDFGKAQPH
jgi:hypothetical protein